MTETPTIVIENPWTKPTVEDVASVLRARTKDLDGIEIGDFNENTRPTGTEAQRLIDIAYDEITGYVGAALPTRCAGHARSLCIKRAAWWIEVSYWPEQVRSSRSVADQLVEEFRNGIPTLQACVEG